MANFWLSWAAAEQKEYIKQRVLYYLLDQPPSLFPNFVVIKLLKLMVDIGKNDWPLTYPNFFANIEELVCDSQRY